MMLGMCTHQAPPTRALVQHQLNTRTLGAGRSAGRASADVRGGADAALAQAAAQPAVPVAAPSGDPNAVAALTRSVAAIETLSHNVQMTTSRSMIRASVDPPGGTGMFTDQEGSSQFAETVLNGQVWLKLDIDPNTNKQLGVTPNTWMSLDLTKLPKNNALPIPPDA